MRKAVNPWRKLPVHRIFVLTEHGLTPELVTRFLEDIAPEHGCKNILDPFVGSGTVAVEALKRGFEFVGVDVNPWSLLVTRAKTTQPSSNLSSRIISILERIDKPFIPSPRLSDYHPQPHLRNLGLVRAAIEALEYVDKIFALAVFGEVAQNFSLLRRSPAPEYIRTIAKADQILVYYIRTLEEALRDMSQIKYTGIIHLVFADSTKWLPRRVECVLTSPPFANNVDYVRHTMLQLLWAGFAKDSRDLGWLRNLQVPSCEAAARTWRQETNDIEIRKLAENIRGSRAKGYRRFLLQYFHSMEEHLSLLAERLEGVAWYTVGDSILGGTYIPTHKLLAKIAQRYGLRAAIRYISKRFRGNRNLYLLELKSPK